MGRLLLTECPVEEFQFPYLLIVVFLHRQSIAPSVVGSLKDGDDKGKAKAKPPIVIWPEWSDQDINQEKWVG